MNPLQVALTVEAVLIVVAMLFGWWVSRKRRPYGKVKVGLHLFFFLWFSTGYGFIATSPSLATATQAVVVAIAAMGLALAVQVGTGLVMLVRPPTRPVLPRTHLVSAALLLVCDLAAFTLSGLGPG